MKDHGVFLSRPVKSMNANYLINEDSYKNQSRPRHSQKHKATIYMCAKGHSISSGSFGVYSTHTYIQEEF